MGEEVLRVSKIKNGTVIDHITGGHALDVAKILGITGREERVITIAMNVPSKRFRTKDIVKIEGRELNPQEVHKIALLAPHASINIIRNYRVTEKQRVRLPKQIQDIVKCTNPACITNSNEPIQPKFRIQNKNPLQLKCHYCGHLIEKKDILEQF
ncbi:MAG: aspartate carbamoyltransferase regulatory subunit [Thermoproteota archaeon]